MPTTVAAIFEAAQELLASATAALESTEEGFSGVAYQAPGLPAFDFSCDFVVVWCSAITLARSGAIPATQRYRTGPRVNLVTMNVTSGRCTDTGTTKQPPTGGQQTLDAQVHVEDGLALWNHIGNEIASGDLLGGTCKQVALGTLTAYTPQGGVAGWNLPVTVQIDGYPESP